MADDLIRCPCCDAETPKSKVREHLRKIHAGLVSVEVQARQIGELNKIIDGQQARLVELHGEPKLELLTFPEKWMTALVDIVQRVEALRVEIVAKHGAPPPMIRSLECICSDPQPHFCPPCFGERGFFACDPVRFPR